MKTIRNTIIAAAAVIALTSCSAPADGEGPHHDHSHADAPTTANTRPAEDIAADFLRELSDEDQHVTAIDVPEPGRLEIDTDLEDPGRETAPEALLARTLCEAGARVDGVEYVAVHEHDGTLWVVYGHPAYGPECIIP